MLHSLFRFSSLFTCLVFSLFWPSATTFYIFLTLVILTMLHSLFRFSFYMSDHVFSLFWPSATTFYIFLTLVILNITDHVFSLFWPSATTFYIFLTLVILTMLHSLFRFSSLFTCLTMFFHCFGPLLPLFIFFLPWSFWPCCTHFSGFLHFLRVWPCFFTVLALCYHFLYFSYLGHFDHVALTFQVVSQCNQVLEHLCYHVAHIQVSTSDIKRVTATFCSAVLSSHFDST